MPFGMRGKAMQQEANFHTNVRSQDGDKALACPGEHQSMRWPKVWLCNVLGGAGIVAKHCRGGDLFIFSVPLKE